MSDPGFLCAKCNKPHKKSEFQVCGECYDRALACRRDGYWYWAISIDTTKAAMGRLGEALLVTRAGLSCGPMSRMNPIFPFGRGISIHLVVQIPDGAQDDFKAIAKPIHMEANPPLISIGMHTTPDDGHPGRHR